MALGMMDQGQLGQLCRMHKVALMDYRQFWALGVHPVSPIVREGPWLDALRRQLDSQGCGRPVMRPVTELSR
jgi:hypothetical protein